MGDPGLPAKVEMIDLIRLIHTPHHEIAATAAVYMSRDIQWTKSDTWDGIWQILPPDTDEILAHARENILSEVIN